MHNGNARSGGRKWSITLISIAMGVGVHRVGIAQEATSATATLEEVVITAERRSEDIQKTAVSVSVRNGDDLQEEGKYSLASILEDVPGMQGGAAANNLGTSGSGTDNQAAGLTIRGIPSNVGVGGAISSVASAAAIYVDGVYEGVGGGYDIDRVEALRGPQGTLYGRSATSGLIAIHTRDPKLGEFNGNVAVEAGNYQLRHYTGGVNVPLGDTVALRVSGNKYQRNGFFVDQGGPGGGSGGTSDITDGRMKLLIQPGDVFSVLLGAALQNSKTVNGGVTAQLTSPDSTFLITPQPSSVSPGQNKFRQYWAELNWDLGFGQLVYLPAYRTWTSQTLIFSRPTSAGIGGFDQDSTTDHDTFWTHELHLGSKPDSKLAWQVGAFYYDNALHNNVVFHRYPSGAFYRSQNISRDTKALSGFAEATYPFTDASRVTAGLRYDSTKVQVNEAFTNNLGCTIAIPGGVDSVNYCKPENLVVGTLSGDAGKRTFNKMTYKARLEHDFTTENMVYAMVSTGVSPGDVVLAVDLKGTAATNPTFGLPIPKEIHSETLTSYEVGSKNRFLDNRLQINGDLFYYDYGAYQVANANVNGTVVNGVFVVIVSPTQFEALSAPLISYGAELETLFQATPNDRFGLNYSYTKAKFHDKNQPVPGTSGTFGDFFGLDEVPNVVPQRASLSYDHRFDVPGGSKLLMGGATRWIGPHNETGLAALSKAQVNTVFAAVSPWIHANGEFVTDLNINWTSSQGMYSVTGWVRNIFDNEYKQAVVVNTVNATNVANGTAFNNIAAVPYDPRTYGLSVNVKW